MEDEERIRTWAAAKNLTEETAAELIKHGFNSMEFFSLLAAEDLKWFKIPLGQQKLLMRAVEQTFIKKSCEGSSQTSAQHTSNETSVIESPRISGPSSTEDSVEVNTQDVYAIELIRQLKTHQNKDTMNGASSGQAQDELEDMPETSATSTKQVKNSDPVSFHPDKIQEQVAESKFIDKLEVMLETLEITSEQVENVKRASAHSDNLQEKLAENKFTANIPEAFVTINKEVENVESASAHSEKLQEELTKHKIDNIKQNAAGIAELNDVLTEWKKDSILYSNSDQDESEGEERAASFDYFPCSTTTKITPMYHNEYDEAYDVECEKGSQNDIESPRSDPDYYQGTEMETFRKYSREQDDFETDDDSDEEVQIAPHHKLYNERRSPNYYIPMTQNYEEYGEMSSSHFSFENSRKALKDKSESSLRSVDDSIHFGLNSPTLTPSRYSNFSDLSDEAKSSSYNVENGNPIGERYYQMWSSPNQLKGFYSYSHGGTTTFQSDYESNRTEKKIKRKVKKEKVTLSEEIENYVGNKGIDELVDFIESDKDARKLNKKGANDDSQVPAKKEKTKRKTKTQK